MTPTNERGGRIRNHQRRSRLGKPDTDSTTFLGHLLFGKGTSTRSGGWKVGEGGGWEGGGKGKESAPVKRIVGAIRRRRGMRPYEGCRLAGASPHRRAIVYHAGAVSGTLEGVTREVGASAVVISQPCPPAGRFKPTHAPDERGSGCAGPTGARRPYNRGSTRKTRHQEGRPPQPRWAKR